MVLIYTQSGEDLMANGSTMAAICCRRKRLHCKIGKKDWGIAGLTLL